MVALSEVLWPRGVTSGIQTLCLPTELCDLQLLSLSELPLAP